MDDLARHASDPSTYGRGTASPLDRDRCEVRCRSSSERQRSCADDCIWSRGSSQGAEGRTRMITGLLTGHWQRRRKKAQYESRAPPPQWLHNHSRGAILVEHESHVHSGRLVGSNATELNEVPQVTASTSWHRGGCEAEQPVARDRPRRSRLETPRCRLQRRKPSL